MCIDGIHKAQAAADGRVTRLAARARAAQHGATLVELIMFIVIVSTALSGVLLVINSTMGHSADTLTRKQALAIAESLLEEVELQYFTYCDPDDANAATAANTAGCAVMAETAMAAEAGETRYAVPKFDNVNDYHGFTMSGANIKDVAGNAIAGLGNYTAAVSVAPAALGNITLASGDALLITVTVDGPGGVQVVLDGYRTRYAPNLF